MLEKFMGVEFDKFKFSGLDGATVVTFTEQSGPEPQFQIRATPMGVTMRGVLAKVISSRAELNEFARLVGAAWTEHERLKPKIITHSGDAG
jgi:hypothetical protein